MKGKLLKKQLLTLFVSGCVLFCLPLRTFAACTTEQLAEELTTDPMSLDYATYVTAKNDAALLALLTEIREGEDYLVSKGEVTKDAAIGTWADIIAGIPFIANATLKTKWTWYVEILFINRATVNYADAQTAAFFAEMVSDGLLTGLGAPITSEDITARTTRQGSRAEVVCGSAPADRVTLNAVACASHGHMCQ
jgi:hypothetical protein